MTNLQEDLTGAFERRASAAIVEDNLDAILTGTNVIRFSSHDDSPPRGGTLLAVAASAAVLAGAAGLVWALTVRSDTPAPSSPPAGPAVTIPAEFPSDPPRPDTLPSGSIDPDVTVDSVYTGSTDTNIPADTAPIAGPPATIPEAFPDDVPRPETFDAMSIMWWDDAPVGWEFSDQAEPTDSIERCAQYASSFGPDWTSAAITDEAESVRYARSFTNAAWQVGVYCIEDGGYLVQVMPAAS